MYRVTVYRNKDKIITMGNFNFSDMCGICDMIPWHEGGPYLVVITCNEEFYSDFKTDRVPQCLKSA